MGKFFEYPTPSGIAAGDEKIVMEKSGITYSPSISYIALAVLGDVDVVGISDNDTLVWNSTSEKWEATNYTVSGLSDATITNPQDDDYLKYSGGVWVNTAFPTSTTSLEALTDTNFTTGAGIDGYALAWDNGTTKWTAQAVSGNPFDQDLNTTNDAEFNTVTATYMDILDNGGASINVFNSTNASTGIDLRSNTDNSADQAKATMVADSLTQTAIDLEHFTDGGNRYYAKIQLTNSTGPLVLFRDTNTTYLQFKPAIADGATAVAYEFDTENDLATAGAKIALFQNQGTEVVSIHDGGLDVTGAFLVNGSPLSVDLTAIASNVVADTTSTYDLGTLTHEWTDLHLSGAVYKSGTELTPVVASDTEPADTSIFWIDTSV